MENAENKPSLTATVYKKMADLAQIEDQWRQLHQLDSTNPFTHPTWIKNWWLFFSRDGGFLQKKPELIVLRDENDQLRAVFPMAETSIGIGKFRLTRLNAAGAIPKSQLIELTPYLVAPGFEQAAAKALVETLKVRRNQYHGIDLERIPKTHPFGIALRQNIDQPPVEKGAYFIVRLPETFDELRPKGRKNSNKRREIRQAETAVMEGVETGLFGAPQFEIVTDPTKILDSMGQFFDLHRARAHMKNAKHHDDNYSSPQKQQFIRNVATDLAAEGKFFLAQLRIDSQVVASELLLPSGRELFLYSTAFDPKYAQYKVMAHLVTHILGWAIKNDQFSTVNLSPGRAQNKLMWSPLEVPVDSFRISPTSDRQVKGEQVYDGVYGLKTNFREFLTSIRKAQFHSN